MRQILIIAVLASTLQAASNRVCWQPKPDAIATCTGLMNPIAANAYLDHVNHAFPETRHWIISESNEGEWQKLSWIGTGLAVAAALYDVHTTQQVLAAGGVESNFLYGSHPSNARLYGFSLGLIGAQTLFAQWWKRRHPENAKSTDQISLITNSVTASVHLAAAAHNESVLSQQRAINAAARQ